MRYCIMGDSIARGYGCPQGEKCWADQIAELFPDWEVINMATNGESSRQALVKIERLMEMKPDIVSFQYGMNDHYILKDRKANVEPSEFRKNMETLISCVPDASVLIVTNHAILVGDPQSYYFSRHPRNLYLEDPNTILNRYNDVLREIARENSLMLLDMFTVSSRYVQEDFLRSRKNTPMPDGNDGVHLHALGNKVYAEQIAVCLGKLAAARETERA